MDERTKGLLLAGGIIAVAGVALLMRSKGGLTVSLVYSPTAPLVGQPVSFGASAGVSVVSYHWSFGDGASADTAEGMTSHAYSMEGSYTVTVTVQDSAGAMAEASVVVTVHPAVLPVTLVLEPPVVPAFTVYTVTGIFPAVTPVRFTYEDTAGRTFSVDSTMDTGGVLPFATFDVTLREGLLSDRTVSPGALATVNAYQWDGAVWVLMGQVTFQIH